MRLGKPDAAQKYFDESLALLQRSPGPARPGSRSAAGGQIKRLPVGGRSGGRRAKRARRRWTSTRTTLPELHPDRTYAESQLGEALRLQGTLDEASVLLKEALLANRRVYGENNRRVADVLDSLAKIRRAQHDLTEAENYAQQAMDIQIKAEGSDHWRTAYYRTSLAAIQIERQRVRRGRRAVANGDRHVARSLLRRPSVRRRPRSTIWAKCFCGPIVRRTPRLPSWGR